MQSLLRQILNKAKDYNFRFRINALQLYNYNCEKFITDWHTDADLIIKTLKEVEVDEDNIHFIHEDDFVIYHDLLKDFKEKCYQNYENYLEDFGKEVLDKVFSTWHGLDSKDYMTPTGNYPYDSDEHTFDQIVAEYMLSGDHYLIWTNWGGNGGIDCFTDCDGSLYSTLNLKELIDHYEKDLEDFLRF